MFLNSILKENLKQYFKFNNNSLIEFKFNSLIKNKRNEKQIGIDKVIQYWTNYTHG